MSEARADVQSDNKAEIEVKAEAAEEELAEAEVMDDDENRRLCNPAALVLLQHVFTIEPFPSKEMRDSLATKLNAHPRQIQTWFQERRAGDAGGELQSAKIAKQPLPPRCGWSSGASASHELPADGSGSGMSLGKGKMAGLPAELRNAAPNVSNSASMSLLASLQGVQGPSPHDFGSWPTLFPRPRDLAACDASGADHKQSVLTAREADIPSSLAAAPSTPSPALPLTKGPPLLPGNEIELLAFAEPPFHVVSATQPWVDVTGYSARDLHSTPRLKLQALLGGGGSSPSECERLTHAMTLQEPVRGLGVTALTKERQPFKCLCALEPLRPPGAAQAVCTLLRLTPLESPLPAMQQVGSATKSNQQQQLIRRRNFHQMLLQRSAKKQKHLQHELSFPAHALEQHLGQSLLHGSALCGHAQPQMLLQPLQQQQEQPSVSESHQLLHQQACQQAHQQPHRLEEQSQHQRPSKQPLPIAQQQQPQAEPNQQQHTHQQQRPLEQQQLQRLQQLLRQQQQIQQQKPPFARTTGSVST